jgi:predicted transcriptional regulator
LKRPAGKRYGNYRNASAVVNRLVQYGMLTECIVRDHQHQTPRVSFAITEKGKAALHMFH